MESLDFENICRLCLDKDAIKDLSVRHKKFDVDYYFLLSTCFSIQAMENDHLPSKMCKKCEKVLVNYYSFRSSVIENDTKLKELIVLKNEPVKLEETDAAYEIYQDSNLETYNSDIEDNCKLIEFIKMECKESETKKVKRTYRKRAKSDDETYIRTKSGRKKVKGMFQCDECEKSFGFKENLRQHKRTHNSERPYQCQICGKRFKLGGNLSEHKKLHTGDYDFECNVCKKKFLRARNLKRHMLTHTGEKPYVCHECGKAFSQSQNLSVHIRIHTGEMPYQCDLCQKRFTQETSLVKHKRTHTGEKLFTCQTCGKSLSSAYSLQVHMRTHTGELPYTCQICLKGFTTSGSMKVHIRLAHNKEKNYECKICHVKLSQSQSLKDHLITHTDLRPEMCKICGRTFRTKNGLNKHTKLHLKNQADQASLSARNSYNT